MEKEEVNDPVSHPKHYNVNGFEVLDILEAFGLGFHLGNVVKYVLRAPNKNGLEDLKKAQFYLNRYIDLCEKANVPETRTK